MIVKFSPANVSEIGTFYVRDASGNIMSIYEKVTPVASQTSVLIQKEISMYGSSRLGVWNSNRNVTTLAAIDYSNYSGSFVRGNKLFELSNHLGNVLVTVSDKKIGHDAGNGTIDYDKADVVTANDYYPGGMTLPGRKYQATPTSKYRYSINGQEKESELNENITTAMYWEYDSRIGRRWNVDPVQKTDESPYLCFSGNPIFYKDILGDEAESDKGKKKKKAKAASSKTTTPAAPAPQTKTVTDAGHGINGDPGASSGTGCNTGVDPCAKEAELALKIEEATSYWLGQFGVTNTRTRDAYIKPGGDQVKYRIKKGNDANAEILVSFHLDWEKGRKYVSGVYQQSEGSSKSVEFEDNSKRLAGLIIGELSEMNADNSAKVVPVFGNTRFKTLGVLNGFKGNAATLVEFGSVGDAKNVQLINTNADAIGRQVATGMYLYLYGTRPSVTGNDPKWRFPMPNPVNTNPSSNFPWLFPFKNY